MDKWAWLSSNKTLCTKNKWGAGFGLQAMVWQLLIYMKEQSDDSACLEGQNINDLLVEILNFYTRWSIDHSPSGSLTRSCRALEGIIRICLLVWKRQGANGGLHSESCSVTEFHCSFTLAAELRVGGREKNGRKETSKRALEWLRCYGLNCMEKILKSWPLVP